MTKKEHIEKLAQSKRGKFLENSCHWKGGKSIHAAGYVMIRSPKHPKKANGYVFEHRLIMEKHLGRYLNKKEVVHHINGKRQDNRLENLIILTNSEHGKIHFENPKRNCLVCNAFISQPRKNTIYCSRACNYAHRWGKPIYFYHR